MKWCWIVLTALGLALSYVTPVWAQGAARPAEPSSGAGLVILLIGLVPFLIVVIFLVFAMRRTNRNMTQIDRSLEMSEESLRLSQEQVTLQKETNRLLGQLIDSLRRY